MVEFTTPINHNLIAGSEVRISAGTQSGIYATPISTGFTVYRTGDESGENRNNIFVVDVPPTQQMVDSIDIKFKRVVQGQESEYYVRKVMPLANANDYDLFKESFATNIYDDRTHQLVYNSDVELLSLKDNKGMPISELYLTIIKDRDTITTDDFFWEPIQSGIQTKVDNNYNIRNITKTKGVAIETNITTSGDIGNIIESPLLSLDFVEYNKMDIRETTLADIYHRTNTKNREDEGCEEGYFYLPHHFIKIRDFSNDIEFGDPETVIGIPEWAEDYTDGTKMWRDMYTIGFVDSDGNGVDYPFLNGIHYMFTNIQLNLLRQDPFDLYDLNASDCYVIGPYGIIEDDKEQDFYEC